MPDRPAPLLVVLAALAAFVVGLGLPDLDQMLPLPHRSALTHSIVPTLLLLARREWRTLAGGVGIGSGVHLAADTFPNAMVGFATVKLPLVGSLGATASYAWLATNALLAALIGASVLAGQLPRRAGWPVALALLAGSIAYLFVTDGGWPALGVLAAGGWARWRWSARQQSSSLRA